MSYYNDFLKRSFRVFLIAFCFIFQDIGLQAQICTRTINNSGSYITGSPYMYYIPFYRYYKYGASEVIYTAAEVGAYGRIQAIRWNITRDANTAAPTVDIYMKSTSATTVGTTASTTGYTLVYSGSFPCDANGWRGVTLSTPFMYTSDNLSVLVVNRSNTYTNPWPDYSYYNSTSNSCSYYYSDPDAWNSTRTMTRTNTKPILQLDFTGPSGPPVFTAANITVGPVRDGAGIGTPLLADANITTPSEAAGHESWRGRLFSPLSTTDYNWYDTYANWGAWQVDLGSVKNVNGVITQGRFNSNIPVPPTGQHVTTINVQVSSNGSTWTDMGNYNANTDHQTPVSNIFPSSVQARYVRITPTNAVSAACMRADVISIPCGTGTHQVSMSAQLPAGSDPALATIRWYTAATGGTLLGTGLHYTASISTSTTFYAATYMGGCESSTRTPVTAIVGQAPSTPTIATNPSTPVCGDPLTLLVGSADVIKESAYGLVVHYPFNGSLNDISGNGLNLSGSGGSFVSDGLQLTTTSSYSSAVSGVLNTDYHTISFYMKYTAAQDGSWRKIFGYEPTGSDRSPGIWKYPDAMRLHWRYDGGNTGGGEGQTYTINQWYLVTGVKNGSNFSLYVNGTLVESFTVASPKTAGNAALFFGGAQVVLRDFKVFNRALSATQVAGISQWKWYTGSCGGTYVGTGPSITVNPTTTTTYFVRSENSCGATTCSSYTVSAPSSAPSSVTGGGAYCHGNTVTLTSTGGSNGAGAVDVWFKGANCNEAYTQRWNAAPTGAVGNTTVNSVSNGILNVTSTSNDPMIDMYTLGSFSPATYRYINVRYRVTAGSADNIQIFWTNSLYSGANGNQVRTQAVSSPLNTWQIVSIDMANTALGPGTWTHSNVTGWRFDWATASGVTMDIDFVTLSEYPMVGQGSTLSVTPTATSETYYTKKIGSCNSTTCQSATITLPAAGTVLAGDGTRTATCTVSGNNWVHFYDNGELIVSVNANGGNLGSVTATSHVVANDDAIITQACNTGTNPLYTTAAMGRRWVITPSTNASALIRFPFETGEFSKLATASTTVTTLNPSDNVSVIGNLKLSLYSGGYQDGSWSNNCTDGGTEIVGTQTGVASNDVTTASGFPATVSNGKFVQFTTPHFSEFWLHNTGSLSPLPVTLVSFSAACESSVAQLKWTTATETSSQKFILERSRDHVTWEVVKELAAAGNSSQYIHYAYTDNDPLSGISYYRLVQVDNNGERHTYSPISVSCETGDDNQVTVFPNPNKGTFTVEISSAQLLDQADLQVIDMAGKIVEERRIIVEKGLNQVLIDNRELQMGVYTVRIRTKNNPFKPVKVVVNE